MDSVSKQKNKSELDDLISEGFAYQRDLEDKGTFIVSPNFLIHKIAELRQEVKLLKSFVLRLPQQPVTDIELYARQLIDADRLKHIKIIEMENDLSARSINALSNDGFLSLGDVTFRTESEMLRIKNFGRKSLNELKEVLEKYGACLKKTNFRMGYLEQDLLILFWDKIKTDFLLPYKIYNAILGKKWVKNGIEKIITKEKADYFLNKITGSEPCDNRYNNTEDDDNLIKEALFERGWVEFPCYISCQENPAGLPRG